MQGCGVFREVLNVPGEVDQGRVIEGVGHKLAGLVHSERAPVRLRPAGRTRLRPPWAAYPGLHKALVIGEQRVQQILEFADLDAAEHDPRVEDLLLALGGFQWPRGPRVWLGVAFELADSGPAIVVAQGHVRQLEAIKIGPRFQGRDGIAGESDSIRSRHRSGASRHVSSMPKCTVVVLSTCRGNLGEPGGTR